MKRGGPLRRGKRLRKVGRQAERERPYLDYFRAMVLERDGRRCQRCGSTFGVIAHHMRRRSKALPIEEKHDPAFGVALCEIPCHLEIHAGASDSERWFR